MPQFLHVSISCQPAPLHSYSYECHARFSPISFSHGSSPTSLVVLVGTYSWLMSWLLSALANAIVLHAVPPRPAVRSVTLGCNHTWGLLANTLCVCYRKKINRATKTRARAHYSIAHTQWGLLDNTERPNTTLVVVCMVGKVHQKLLYHLFGTKSSHASNCFFPINVTLLDRIGGQNV